MRPDPALVAALTASTLPQGLCVAASDPCEATAAPDASEAASLRGAVPRRVMEFHAGRAAARRAMESLGVAVRPVPMAPDRAPLWPPGVTGSISHSATACVAVVGHSHTWAGIGVDLEEAIPLDPLLVAEICTRAEQGWLGQQPQEERGLMAKLIFSAKEAVYKAQYPVTQTVFGFDALGILVNRDQSRFIARFRQAQGPIAAGTIMSGGYAHAAGLLVTGVAVGHSALKQSLDD